MDAREDKQSPLTGQNDTLHLDPRCSEIDKQAKHMAGGFQVVQALGKMDNVR